MQGKHSSWQTQPHSPWITHTEHAGRWRHRRQRTPIQQSHLLLQSHRCLLVCYVLQQCSTQRVQVCNLRVCSIHALRELHRDRCKLCGFCSQCILHLVLDCLAIWACGTQRMACLKLLQRCPVSKMQSRSGSEQRQI
eukprot:GHRQ01028222.1.p2 GENE.GHRQ01028222.1~~GHRQ01028222.1.p2  ORF type:complete len:137 (+),score=24.21 GHRQ01028222.1:158-568(+)